MSYYAITIFKSWGLPPTSVAILFQVSLIFLWNSVAKSMKAIWSRRSYAIPWQQSPNIQALIQRLKILIQITTRFLILVNFFTTHQATITLGYILSPLVMRRVNTRPQVQSQRTDELSFFKKHFGLWFEIDHKYFGIRVAEVTRRREGPSPESLDSDKKFWALTHTILLQY